jgi:uncharacterized repeat protein (TIGR01451 family)
MQKNMQKTLMWLVVFISLFTFQSSAQITAGELKWDGELHKGEYIIIENYYVIFEQLNMEKTWAQITVRSDKGDEGSMLLGEGDSNYYQNIEVKLSSIYASSNSIHIAVYAPKSYLFRGGPYGGPGTGLTDIPILQLTKIISATKVGVGDLITVYLEVKNIGNGDALSVAVNDPFPPEFAYVSGNNYWTGTIPPNIVIPLHYVLRATKPGIFQVSGARADYKNASGYANTSFSKSFTIEVLGNITPVKKAVLDVKIIFEKREVIEGEEFNVRIEATNVGNATAKNIRFQADLPQELQVVKGDLDYFILTLEERNIKKYEAVLKAVKVGTYNIKINTIHDTGGENFTSDLIVVKEGPYAFLFKLPLHFYLLPAALVAIATGWIVWRHKQFKY